MRFSKLWYVVVVVFFTLLGIGVGVYVVTVASRIISPLAPGAVSTPDPILEQVKGVRTSMGEYPPNDYFPKTLIPKYDDDLELTAGAYAAMDRDSGELLLSKNLDEEHPIASLAKIMTAIIALENFSLDAQLKVGREASITGEAYMGVSEGEIYTVADLLYGVMLPSGNDAAETIARGLRPKDSVTAIDLAQRRRNWFLQAMNTKAQDLGLADTYFFNPTGLDEDLQQRSTFSTPLDLLALSNYALSNEDFAEIVQTDQYLVQHKDGFHKGMTIYNILQFDRVYPGIKGIKPGVTDYAGETLASYIERDGRRIILILLESQATRDDAIKVYEFLFEEQ